MSKFIKGRDGCTEVYTDGACSNNGRANARAGFGNYWGENNPLNRSEAVIGPATNNRGEIQGATQAIRDAANAGFDKVRIKTDSEFLVKARNEWMPKWQENDWKRSNGQPVKNESDFRALDNAIRANPHMDVQFEHVRGHSGNRHNDRADYLARQGAQKYPSNRY